MRMQEFEALTGFTATPEEYRYIEQQYYDFDGDKLEFCKKWKDHEMSKVAEARQERVEALEERIAELSEERVGLYKKIDKLEKWEPSDCGTNMSQSNYMELERIGKRMELGEAAEKIARFFGFEKSKIKIIEDVETFERNSLGMTRVANRYKRHPVYDATDWNYVRFDCAGQQWEMVDGDLFAYEC